MHERQLSREAQFVRSLDGQFYLLDEVAAMLEISPRRLNRLKTISEELAPSAEGWWGKKRMHLYTPEDVTALIAYLADAPTPVTPGRAVMWTVEQYQDRQRRDKRVRYWRRRATELERRGATARAEEARHKAHRLAAGLHEQYQQRIEELRASGASKGRRRSPGAASEPR